MAGDDQVNYSFEIFSFDPNDFTLWISIWKNSQDEVLSLERKIKALERDLKRNNDIVQEIGKSVAELLKDSSAQDPADLAKPKPKDKALNQPDGKPEGTSDCHSFVEDPPLQADIQMLSVYDQLKFDNPDGGVWKQGWDVQFDEDQFSEQNKLRVFVVPHSHNDPGWIKTLQKYYEDQTRHILDNMVRKLSEDGKRKFIWAEISYLDMWWRDADQETRQKFKNLVLRGQIEIVTGGWVMNDEANTHYFGIVEQLTTGHEWMRQKLGITPQNGWAIDPFGYSSSMAYLLKRIGVDNMVIQRVHYAIKKTMAAQKRLEFRWRQNWGKNNLSLISFSIDFFEY